MDICIDVGNTTFYVGLYENGTLLRKGYFFVDSHLNNDEYEEKVRKTLMNLKINHDDIDRCMYSSVVPDVDKKVIPGLKEMFHSPIQRVKEGHIDLTFGQIDVNEVGDDL
ncbi:MAG: type III pantothenate kinase, partial [Bacilli bacterium]|nr:type III pantothenate kinase [Bacilli bacterium]